MKKQDNVGINSSKLRKKAEELVKQKAQDAESTHSEVDQLKLLHELEVYKIELELQNAELLSAICEAQDAIQLYDFAPAGFFTLSKEGEIVNLNIRGAQMLQEERSNLKGIHFGIFVSEGTKTIFNHFLHRIFQSLAKESCEVTLIPNGRKSIYVHLTGIVSENGENCLITALDLIERKQAEQALKDSEVKYRRLIENSPDAITIYAEGEIVLVNKECLRLMHARSEYDLIGRSLNEFVHPDYRELVAEQMSQLVTDGKPLPLIEEKFVRLDGSVVDIEVKSVPILYENKPAVQLIVRDITERKRSEEALRASEARFRMMFESSLIGILMTNPNGEIYAANPEACRLLGRTEDEICRLGRNGIVDLTNPNLNVALEERSRTGHFKGELTYVCADGTIFPIDIDSGTFTDSAGQTHAYNFFQDISRRKRGQKARFESEANVRVLINATDESIFLVSADETVLALNEIASQRIEQPIEKLIGFKMSEIMSPEVYAYRLPFFNQVLQNGVNVKFDDEHNGRWQANHIFPIFNAEGKVNRYALFSRDITERKEIELALRTSQVFLNSIIENSPNALWISDEQGTLMRMNQACRDIIHIRDEEVVGKYNILKDNLLEEQGLMPLVRDVFEKGIPVRFMTSYDTAVVKYVHLEKTTKIFLDINISPILDAEEKVTHAIIQEIDITEQKLAEEALLNSKQQYDNLVAKIPVGVYILHSKPDESFALDYVSPRMAEMLDLSIEELLADANLVIQSIHPDDRYSFAKMNLEGIQLRQSFDWKGRIQSIETVKWMHFRSTPEVLENGDILWHGIVIDITERITADLKIQHINEELSTAIAQKDKFFSIIAHDLRSPFNVFLGFTEMMVEDLPSMTHKQLQDIAFSMRGSAINLYQLLENLLEWSLMQQGISKADPKSFAVGPKITQSLQSVQESANKKDIELACLIPEELKVLADENMFQSIIRNLTGNAVKFTPKGGKIILSAKPLANSFVGISIQDSGIGMDEELIGKLFTPNERTSRRGTDGELSTGLGLLICKDFVEKNGGQIRAESEKGKGSTFHFTLPAGV